MVVLWLGPWGVTVCTGRSGVVLSCTVGTGGLLSCTGRTGGLFCSYHELCRFRSIGERLLETGLRRGSRRGLRLRLRFQRKRFAAGDLNLKQFYYEFPFE